MKILPATEFLLDAVRMLHDEFHPGCPFPGGEAIVALDEVGDEVYDLAGYALYSFGTTPDGSEYITLIDTVVSPWARGKGVGKALMQARLEIAVARGCAVAVGATTPDNAPMLKILRDAGFTQATVIAAAYPDGRDAIVFSLPLKASPCTN